MKTKIIVSSILIFLVALVAVLFGAVFRLRSQTVKTVGSETLSVSKEEIITSAKLENGSSIFMLDKDKATENIEKAIPNVKVVQIKTTNVTNIEIVVRARVETYYTYFDGFYYSMDEDLKVLNKTEKVKDVANLIYIKEGLLAIDEQTAVCDFVGGEYKEIFYNLYTATYKTATKVVDGKKQYLTRQEVIAMLRTANVEKENTLTEKYNKLIVKTRAGVTFDIAKANQNLEEKINMCVSVYESGEYDITKGIIKLFYDAEGKQHFDYFAQ